MKLHGVGRVSGCYCDADADADHDLVAVEIERRADRVYDPCGKQFCFSELSQAALQDGKFIATETRHSIG